MSFIAGIVSRNGKLGETSKLRFLDSFTAIKKELPWPTEISQNNKHIFARAGFPHMWQGPKMLSGKDNNAVATGVQWRKIPNKRTALEYLTGVLLTGECEIGNYFDYFSCAIIDNNSDHCILATDPLGMSLISYNTNSEVLVFSSLQSFLAKYLGQDVEIDWQGVLEFLIMGHNVGNKTLLGNVSILSPGCKLEMRQNNLQIVQYKKFDNVNIEKDMTLDDATDLIFEHLQKKVEGYSDLSPKNFASFLSGGWDTRFIVSLLAPTSKLAMTYTTQQRGERVKDRLISERKIAREVSNLFGIPNKYISTSSETEKSKKNRLRMMDYTTWSHDWSFAMTERLPYDGFILADGFYGDVWLIGSHLAKGKGLYKCIVDKDRNTAAKILHSKYLHGFRWYVPGMQVWQKIIDSRYLKEFAELLESEITQEINDIHSEDFVSLWLFKNRGRRNTGCLPRLIFGSKGVVILPFCDFEFIQKTLSIPMEHKYNYSLYKALLERSKPGLSSIVSTNTKDADKLEPYLVSFLSDQSLRIRIGSMIQEQCPRLYKTLKGMKNMVSGSRDDTVWIEEIFESPPHLFMDVLNPTLKQGIRNRNVEYLKEHYPILKRIMLLNSFLAQQE